MQRSNSVVYIVNDFRFEQYFHCMVHEMKCLDLRARLTQDQAPASRFVSVERVESKLKPSKMNIFFNIQIAFCK